MPSSRAAILTPSPRISSPSTPTSPRLIPTLNSIRRSWTRVVSRAAVARCTATAQRTASTTLANSTSMPSPVVLKIRPRCSAIAGSISSRRNARSRAKVPSSSSPTRRLYPGDVGRQDRGQLAFDGLLGHSAPPPFEVEHNLPRAAPGKISGVEIAASRPGPAVSAGRRTPSHRRPALGASPREIASRFGRGSSAALLGRSRPGADNRSPT